MLLNLLIPFVLTVGSGSKGKVLLWLEFGKLNVKRLFGFLVVFLRADSPHLEQPEIFLLLQTVINILLPPRIISTSRTKNFMLDASPAHCSTPGDPGKDLRREGLAESTSQAAYLGTMREARTFYSLLCLFPSHPLPSAALKVVLVCFERSLGNQWYRLSLQVKEMALRKVGGLAFWDFIDFIVRTRIPIFVLLRPFIQCKVKGAQLQPSAPSACLKTIFSFLPSCRSSC